MFNSFRTWITRRKESINGKRYTEKHETDRKRREKEKERTIVAFVTISRFDVYENRDGHSGRWIHGTYARLWPDGDIRSLSPFSFETSGWGGKRVLEWNGVIADLLRKAVQQGTITNEIFYWKSGWRPGDPTTITLYYNANGDVVRVG